MPADRPDAPATLQVNGRLRRLCDEPAKATFAIGSGPVHLTREELRAVRLITEEGNEFFILEIELGHVSLVLGDEGVVGDQSEPE